MSRREHQKYLNHVSERGWKTWSYFSEKGKHRQIRYRFQYLKHFLWKKDLIFHMTPVVGPRTSDASYRRISVGHGPESDHLSCCLCRSLSDSFWHCDRAVVGGDLSIQIDIYLINFKSSGWEFQLWSLKGTNIILLSCYFLRWRV